MTHPNLASSKASVQFRQELNTDLKFKEAKSKWLINQLLEAIRKFPTDHAVVACDVRLKSLLEKTSDLEKTQMASSAFLQKETFQKGFGLFACPFKETAGLDDVLSVISELLIAALIHERTISKNVQQFSEYQKESLSMLIDLQKLAVLNRVEDFALLPVSIEEFNDAIKVFEEMIVEVQGPQIQGLLNESLDELKSVFWKHCSYWSRFTHALRSAWKWLLSCLAFPKKLEVPVQPPLKSGSVDQEDGSLGVSSSGKKHADCEKTAGKEPTDCEIKKPAF